MSFSDPSERAHWVSVLHAFETYRSAALSGNQLRRRDFYSLPNRQRGLIGDEYKKLLDDTDWCVRMNADFCEEVSKEAKSMFMLDSDEASEDVQGIGMEDTSASDDENGEFQSHYHYHEDGHSHSHTNDHGHGHDHSHPPAFPPSTLNKKERPDYEKLRSTLRQLVRDWSIEGEKERQETYKPIMDFLMKEFQSTEDRTKIRVLNPGSGLARLSWEISNLGFSSQGNEISVFMLFCSFLILNKCSAANQYTLYPYAHSFSNTLSSPSILRPITIPDVCPSSEVKLKENQKRGEFSMICGEFVGVYNTPQHEGQWDAIVTCFFIDTATNIVDYLETIWRLLKPGGVWINLGPNLWHFESSRDPTVMSIELTIEDIKKLSRKIGFAIEDEREIRTTYNQDNQSLLESAYRAQFWVGRKGRL